MKIGIGITTFKRPQHLETCLTQIRKHSPSDVFIYVADDSKKRKGIAHRKNECLTALWTVGCDYFFLLDDDCFPIADGWLDLYIEASKRTGQEHLSYTPNKKLRTKNGIVITSECSGALIFATRKAVATVGGFYTGYMIYGYEHTGYTMRLHKAGFTSYGQFLTPENAEKYLYALDFDTHLHFNELLQHKSTLTEGEKHMFLQRNSVTAGSDSIIYRPLEGQEPPVTKKAGIPQQKN